MSTHNESRFHLSISETLLRRIWSSSDSLHLMNRQWRETGKVKEGERRIEKKQHSRDPYHLSLHDKWLTEVSSLKSQTARLSPNKALALTSGLAFMQAVREIASRISRDFLHAPSPLHGCCPYRRWFWWQTILTEVGVVYSRCWRSYPTDPEVSCHSSLCPRMRSDSCWSAL